jgi:competence protein ComEC
MSTGGTRTAAEQGHPAVHARSGLDLRLVWPAATCWAVAGVLVALPGWAAAVAVVFWIVAGALVAVAVLRSRAGLPALGTAGRRPGRLSGSLPAILAACCATAALAATAVAVQAPVRLPAVVRSVLDGQADGQRGGSGADGRVVARLTVWSAPVPHGGAAIGGAPQVRFRATLTALDSPPGEPSADGAPGRLSVPVLVFAEMATPAPAIGDEVRVTGALVRTEAGDAASALLFGRGPIEAVRPAPWWLAWANDLRAGFAAAAGELPGDGAGLLPGLAIGDTTAVPENLDAAMKTSSLSHLTAVSGANCAIILALVLAVTAACGLGRRWRFGAALVVLAGFVVLVTPEPSVVRAATMATIVLLAGAMGRPGRGLPALALAGIALLVADPWLSRNYGFVLSVLATLGLLVLTIPLARRLRRWLPAPVAAVLAIPLAAQLACQPVLVLLSPTLPAYGVPANLLAAPAAPIATIAGLAACLLLPWLPWLAVPLVWLAWLPATWIAAVAITTAGLPGSSLPWLGGPLGVGLTLACTAGILTMLPERRPGRRQAVLRIVSGAVLCLAAGCTVGAMVGTGLGRAAVFPANWQIAACDIGQGDAVVVRDGDQVALVDVGPDPALLTGCLGELDVDRVDLLVLTHYDLDHVGGLDAVIGRVDTALVGPPENAQDARLHAELSRGGATVAQTARGDHGVLGGLAWDVLWPVRGADELATGNAGSVTIRFEGRGVRSIFLGDLDEEAQSALLAEGPIGAVDVVKVAHHGSGDQSAALYAELGASLGLVSVGADNGYGHPTRSLLELLRSAGTALVRTDRDGLAVVAPTGAGPAGARAGAALRVWTEKVPGAG